MFEKTEIVVDDPIQHSVILQALKLYKMIFNFPPIKDLIVSDGSIEEENNILDYLIGLFGG